MTPPVWSNALTATAWAVAALAALRASWRHRSMRSTGWLPVWAAQALISCWWAFLNIDRWVGDMTTAEYRDAVAPVVPAVLAVWAATAVVFCIRAQRTQQVVDLITRSETDNDRDS